MLHAIPIIGMFSGLSAFVTLVMFLVKPIRERILGTKAIKEGQKCILRNDMLRTYYKHSTENQIRQYEKENFIAEYKAYKALGGNSFIDDIEKEIRTWDVKS